MDLTKLTVDELRMRLDDLDKNKSPHEAKELSNEIGRRTVVIDEINKNQVRGINTVKRSHWIATACITLFLLMSVFNLPEIKSIMLTLVLSIFVLFTYVRSWTKGPSILSGICIVFIIIVSNRVFSGIFESIQFIALLIGASMTLVYALRGKILEMIENNKL